MGVSAHPYKKKDKNQINTNKIMKQNMTTIPFDLELAKKINNGEYNGTIVTSGRNFRVEFVYYKEDGIYPILGVVHTDHGIISDWFSSNGCGSKNYRLELGVPEYTTFKDGDVLSNKDGDYIFILNANGEYLTSLYASLNQNGILNIGDGLSACRNTIENYRFATEVERQKLIDVLKASKEPKAKEYLKRFFGIEEKPKYDFKPFDKVLVRDEDDKEWHISLFAREIVDDSDGLSYKYECSNGTLWDCCIPFEGNECLLETAEKSRKKMKTRTYEGVQHGDWVRCVLCGAQMLLPCGADKCPECSSEGTLMWVDEDKQEMDAEHLDCLAPICKLELQEYLSPEILKMEHI